MRTIAARHTHEEIVKRSRFVATALRLDDPSCASGLVAEVSDPAATHTCWAWRVGAASRVHDAQEPGGTAGRPILAAIDAQGMDHVLVVVVRTFGGIKLGAGGLVRAYGGIAARCLAAAPPLELRPRVRLSLRVPFEDLGGVHACLDRLDAARLREDWTEAGLDLEVEVDVDSVEVLEHALADLTRGRVRRVERPPGPPGAR
ncbi:MAG: YigZ family protein [Deltaproteobacteria bacterium]|nr:YigZ family protein [Deltaproteobacteria bacterium]